MNGQRYFANNLKQKLISNANTTLIFQVKKWFDCYFTGVNPVNVSLPFFPIGTPFQQLVWRNLCQIPYGTTVTYGHIAKQIANATGKNSMSSQAIGNAVGRNPISILIPCHRVIGANGNLTGYAGGISKKIQLLTLEGINTRSFFIPK